MEEKEVGEEEEMENNEEREVPKSPRIRVLLGDLILIINAQSVAGLDKFRQENQTKDIEKTGGVRGVISQTRR